jgi:hypothetical protein
MTEKDFDKKRFKGYEILHYEPPYYSSYIEVILLAVDFETKLIKICALDDKEGYRTHESSQWVRCEYVFRPTMKKVT